MAAIEVHQSLHGYSDGHRQLAASHRLPRDAERALLIMTDISGPVTAGGFASYLTGWAVPGTTAYALARTWLATELSRPGCVFTHTLLIGRDDLGRIRDLRALVALHRRPRKGDSWQPYGQPLTVTLPPAEPETAARPAWTERGAARALAALYGLPDTPTLLEADQPERVEDLVLAAWDQAWPRLRAALGFCTWSLAPRVLDGAPLDLQVVPPAVSRHLRHTGTLGTVVSPIPRFGQESDTPGLPAWALAAARDLLEGPGSPLRAFLWEFGDDAGAPRAAFAPLAEIQGRLEAVRAGRAPVAELVEAVTARFPSPQAARRLKGELFGDRRADATGLLATVPEAEVLGALAATPHHAALDAEALALRRRAGELWTVAPEQALDVAGLAAAAVATSPLADALAAGMAAAVGLAAGLAIRERRPAVFAALARHNPTLAVARLVAPPGRASESPRPPGASGSPVPPAGPPPPLPEPPPEAAPPEPVLAVPGPPGPTEPAPAELEPATASEVLARLDRVETLEELAHLTTRWRGLLARHPAEVARWLAHAAAPRAGTAVVAASVLDPHAPEAHGIGADAWLRAVGGAESQLDRATQVRLMAFLLALAFAEREPGAAVLAARAFATVDRAAATGELPADAWQRLAGELPALPWWRESDRAERLRRGLVERFVRGRWPADALLKAAPEDETFQRLVEICEWTREGQAFLKQLAGHVSRGRLEATPGQREALARYG